MDLPKRFSIRTDGWVDGAIYVGRPSPYGNRYTNFPNAVANNPGLVFVRTVADAVRFFEEEQLPQIDVQPLMGRDILCWCRAGELCHGDSLLRAAESRRLSEALG